MRELKIGRRQANKFTVTVSFNDYNAFPYDGTFPIIYSHYRIDTEEELIAELNKEEMLFAQEVDTIYFGTEDVTEKYLTFIQGQGYTLLAHWKT